MKIIQSLTLITGFLLLSLGAISQPPPPPGNPSTSGNAPVGSGAPIGSGTMLLIGFAAAYGARKVYVHHNSKESEVEE